MTLECISPEQRLAAEADGLVAVPIPALVFVLSMLADEKGAPLTRAEVEGVRDSCACMMLPPEAIKVFEASRGYFDVRPEHVWEDWQSMLAGGQVSP